MGSRYFSALKYWLHNLSRIISLLLALVLACGTLAAYAAPAPASEDFTVIDAFIQQQMQKGRLPGVAYAIVQGDKVVQIKAFGISGPDKVPLTPQTPMFIGPLSTSLTAMAVMQLVDAGKIDLDKPVQNYLPWFRVATKDASGKITVRHLLNQTSGFPESAGQRTLADNYSGSNALESEVHSYANVQLTQAPGAKVQYSNANYTTAGMIVQMVFGQSYEEYIQTHILDPLQMEKSYTALDQAQQNGLATGYRMIFSFPVAAPNIPYPRAHVPDSYLISSVEDMAHYLIANLNGGSYNGTSILSPASIQTMHTATTTEVQSYFFKTVGCGNKPGAHYAMGWWNLELNSVPVVCNSGDTPDFHVDMVQNLQDGWGIVLMMNVSGKLMAENVHGLITGVTGLVANHTPIQEPADMNSRLLYGGLAIVILFELFVNGRVIRQLLNRPKKLPGPRRPKKPKLPEQQLPTRYALVRPVVTSLVAGGLLIYGMPMVVGIPFNVMQLNQPDFTFLLLLCGFLIALRGALQSLYYWLTVPHRN